MKVVAFAAASMSAFASASAKTYFHENFDSGDISSWVPGDREGLGEFKLAPGEFYLNEEDLGLQTSEDARFYGIATKFAETFDNTEDTLVIQLSVKHEQNIDCGGGYIKIYGDDVDLASLDGESPYNIMFGPDICGSKKMVHVIFSYKGENYLIKKSIRPPSDVYSHAYTLVVKQDNTYQVLIDNRLEEYGSLTDDWDMLKPKMIKDPEASKPDDWVDEQLIDDPNDEKPADWDDIPEMIPDEDIEQPEDWDDDMDGEWERPMIRNPDYQGEWAPARIANPLYKGEWEHPLIDNPEYEEDTTLYAFTSGAVGVDIWQVKSGTVFDDILVTSDVEEAKAQVEKIIARRDAEKSAKEAADAKKEEETDNSFEEYEEEEENEEEEDVKDEL